MSRFSRAEAQEVLAEVRRERTRLERELFELRLVEEDAEAAIKVPQEVEEEDA